MALPTTPEAQALFVELLERELDKPPSERWRGVVPQGLAVTPASWGSVDYRRSSTTRADPTLETRLPELPEGITITPRFVPFTFTREEYDAAMRSDDHYAFHSKLLDVLYSRWP